MHKVHHILHISLSETNDEKYSLGCEINSLSLLKNIHKLIADNIRANIIKYENVTEFNLSLNEAMWMNREKASSERI
jgi:hypothetical protein